MIITRVDWQKTKDRKNLPHYGVKVLIVRPNIMSGEFDQLLGRLERAKEEGIHYGKDGNERYTYDDYWVVQGVGILRFDRVVLWAPRPIIPDELKQQFQYLFNRNK